MNKLLLTLLAAAAMTACGGGGSSTTTPNANGNNSNTVAPTTPSNNIGGTNNNNNTGTNTNTGTGTGTDNGTNTGGSIIPTTPPEDDSQTPVTDDDNVPVTGGTGSLAKCPTRNIASVTASDISCLNGISATEGIEAQMSGSGELQPTGKTCTFSISNGNVQAKASVGSISASLVSGNYSWDANDQMFTLTSANKTVFVIGDVASPAAGVFAKTSSGQLIGCIAGLQ